MTQGFRSFLCIAILAVLSPPALAQAAPEKSLPSPDHPAAGAVSFNRDIRPLLAENCYACHGPDEKVRKAHLHFDTQEAALSELSSGKHAIVPGKPQESELVRRITHTDPDERMPPEESQKTLSEKEILLLQDWIAQGALWEKHWAFVKPDRQALPKPSDETWPRNDIDRFILARLDEEGISPSIEADKPTLIRRLTLDLTGLPPTLDEVDAFVNDKSPRAYEDVVDRLLASPRYGEHMARFWLDLARYADTNGYHIDNERSMWPWRDWVIRAYNDNKPFDEFTIEQLAGDLLPDPTLDQQIATGFNRNHMINFEGGAIAEEYQTQYVIDRINTTGTVWMGLTLGCAQCHEHKFDPISQQEFYELYAFFNTVPEKGLDGKEGNASPFIKVPDPDQETKLAAVRESIASVQDEMERPVPDLDKAQATWEAESAQKLQGRWSILEPSSIEAGEGVTFDTLDDGSLLVSGENPHTVVYEFVAPTDLQRITALRLEALTHQSLPHGGAGRADNANFVLTEIEAEIIATEDPGEPIKLPIKVAKADYQQSSYEVRKAIDGKPDTGWAVDGEEHREDRAAYFVLEQPTPIPDGTRLRIRLKHESDFPQHAIGRFRIAVTDDESLLPSNFGQWYLNGPFVADNGNTAYETEYGPESHIDLNETYDDGRLKWVQARPTYPDGEIHQLSGNVAATYLYRTLRSPSERAMRLALGSNDAIKVWVNGEVVHDNNIQRTIEKNQDYINIELRKGENAILMKIVNYGNDYAFYFRMSTEDMGEIPLRIEHSFTAGANRSGDANKKLKAFYRERHWPEWDDLAVKLAALHEDEESIENDIPTTMIMEEMETPRKTFILTRGQYDLPGDEVTPATPAALLPLPEDAPKNRLGLAQWLVHPDHPLTARVIVNRYWQRYFGAGIVKTAEDFGTQGEWPTHPQLLDWLATEFMQSDWDIKHMQRLIVTSATYRQDSPLSPNLAEIDPENRLLARGPRFRLDAETVRDNALAISGLLAEKIGGPSVKPYQPPGIWKEVAYGAGYTAQAYEQDTGESLYRRSMYTFWKRQAPPPGMMIFDAPNRETCISRRARTNTPLQALALMNDPQFVEAARALAQRIMTEGGPKPAQRIRYAFRLATARTPSRKELAILINIYEAQLAEFQQDEEGAKSLLAVADSTPAEDLDTAELAAWSAVTSVILNLDETITKS